ncbi:putative phage tail protein [Vibrio ruber]|uniref:YmfQ family protein n=1 Tax=Vibrio ruber TaxID=184755 RepID=UPI002892E5D0|nr:putative phage tail protein [Vibrio ruber]WNJ96530.1 putative phage tail protein [Vibrio ruber]
MANINAQGTEAWLSVLQQLMPQGIAWNKDTDSNQTNLLRALAKALSDADTLCDTIQLEMLPSQANIMLDDYETYLGLPDCDGQGDTLIERRNAVTTKDRIRGGLATWQIESLAKDLGFTIKVDEIWPHHCLRSCSYPLYAQRYRHVLKITVTEMPRVRFTCLDYITMPLISNDARVLECTLNKYKMAGKYYDYIYEGDV